MGKAAGADIRVAVTSALRKRVRGTSGRTEVAEPSVAKATMSSEAQTRAQTLATNERLAVAAAAEVLAMMQMCKTNKNVELTRNVDARKEVLESTGHRVDRVQDLATRHFSCV